MIHMKPELIELYEIRRFLPLPYEAAAEPRLKRAQERLAASRPFWSRLPGEGTALLRLHTLAEGIRARGQTLLAVVDGGLRAGVEGVAGCLTGGLGRVRLLSGLPSEEELNQALELAACENVLLYTAGGEHTPAFRLLRAALADRYGPEAGRYVLAPGELSPGEEGGFGLLTAAGLLPMAAAGVDVGELLRGAAAMLDRCGVSSFENPAWRYAAVRRQLQRSGFSVELLCCWEPALVPLLEWVKRLFASAEGKEGKALLPVVVDYSREFGAMGQYIQDGPRMFFETVVSPGGEGRLSRVREAAVEGTLLAHTESGVPNLILRPGGREAEALGGLICFFQFACALSAAMLDADPFARPGTEACEARIRAELSSSSWERREPAALAGIL